MSLRQLLQDREEAIARRWRSSVAADYPDPEKLLAADPDPFANPVGHALATQTRAILPVIRNGMEEEKLRPALEGIIRIQAVQDLPPARALAFVFRLKEAIREELAVELSQPALLEEFLNFATRIDRLALIAFELYSRCREEIAELRLREVKRGCPTS